MVTGLGKVVSNIQLRLSLLGGMFNTVLQHGTLTTATLLMQLIITGIADQVSFRIIGHFLEICKIRKKMEFLVKDQHFGKKNFVRSKILVKRNSIFFCQNRNFRQKQRKLVEITKATIFPKKIEILVNKKNGPQIYFFEKMEIFEKNRNF